MAKIFQISSTSDAVQLDKEGQGSITFQVVNLAKPVAGRALLLPLEDTDEEWLSIEGAEERELATNVPEDVVVGVSVPKDQGEGDLKFRLDVVSEVSPDDDFSEGPEISILATQPRSKRWLWILLFVLLFLSIVFVTACWVIKSDDSGSANGAEAGETEDSVATGQNAESKGDTAELVGIKAPNLMGLSRAEAVEEADLLGLKIEPVGGLGIAGLKVDSQSPRPGQFIEKGGVVTLGLKTLVPDLIGHDEGGAHELLAAGGLVVGEIIYERSDRQSAGRVMKQQIVAGEEIPAGSPIDLTVSLGSCSWTPAFSEGFGLSACRSGSAIAGLSCFDRACTKWQLYCCPYLPGADPEADLALSGWIDRRGKIANRQNMFIDGMECGAGNCWKMRGRYIETPHLAKGRDCKTLDSGGTVPLARCPTDAYLNEFRCNGSTCSQWQISCCPAEINILGKK